MVLKVYISGMSGNKEVKKRQQRVLMILDSKNVKYEVIDITEPGRETDKEFMQNKSSSNGATVSDPEPRHALPPQIFNEEEYCGDYDAFDLANEIDTLEQFLKMAPPVDTTVEEVSSAQQENGDAKPADGEGENKENEQSSEDKTVKDGEENAENAEKADANEKENTDDKKDDEDANKTDEGHKETKEDDDDKKTEVENEVMDDKDNTEEINQQEQQQTLTTNKENDSKHMNRFIESEQQAADN